MPQKVEISSRTIVFTIFFLIGLQIIWQVREVIYALFLAFILMSALKPGVRKLEAYKIPRLLATLIIFLTAIASIVFMLVFVFPPLINESIFFLKSLPVLIAKSFPFLKDQINGNSLVQFLPDISKNFVHVAGGILSHFIFFVSILFFTFYFLLEEKFFKKFIIRFFDTPRANQLGLLIDRVENRMGAWMWSMVVLMSIIGFATYFGLQLLHIKFALSLAFVAGLLEVVPIIGPAISVIPAFFVASSVSLPLGGAVVLMYFIIQQIESNIIVPVVMKKTIGINPIFTLIALSVGSKLGGLSGAILAVPAALLIETVMIEFFQNKD